MLLNFRLHKQFMDAKYEEPDAATAEKASGEYCGNWPCRLPRYHTGPCSSSSENASEATKVTK